MPWQPEEEPLRQLAKCLRDSLSGYDKNAQKQAEIMLAQAKTSPDINNYLTYLFSSSSAPSGLAYSDEEYSSIRFAAAVMLKNNVKTGYKSIPESSLDLIRSSISIGLEDKNPQIRNYAGNVITEIVSKGGILAWPQLLPELLTLIGNESGNVSAEAQEGAMAALAKICEDNRKTLDQEYQGQRPLNVLIPKLIEFTTNPIGKVRSLALSSINVFLPTKSQAMKVNMDVLLAHLFQLANDEVANVRRQVCRAFVQIVEIRPEKILPHIEGLVDYILSQQRKVEEEDLACDAAEFWLTVGEHDALWTSLAPYLYKIVPVLLDSMVYSEEEIAMLEGAEDDADQEDREEDIKPTFAKGKGARNLTNGDAGTTANQNGGSYSKVNEDEDSDDDLDEGEIEEFDDDDDGNLEDQWNLRKCSAAALDVFATDFKGTIFETILPYLMTNLRHEDWPQREAAVLALGAVAEGCMDEVRPHLPDLVPYLLSLLEDSSPMVRQITCWTLGRYSSWAVDQVTENHSQNAAFFVPIMDGLLKKMLDRNKKVQEAGASAFAHLEEKAGKQLIPYCEPIIRQFVQCFKIYKDKNMFILYDCVQTLAEHVGPSLAEPILVNLLMPALIQRWQSVSDQSRELFPLLECLSYVATALGTTFAPFAPPIFARCIQIIHQNLEEYLNAVQNPILDVPDKDFLVTSLDLLSAMIQVLDEAKSMELVSGSQPGFFDLLAFCMEDPTNDVRQSSYALLGDSARFVFPQLQPALPKLMPLLLGQLDVPAATTNQSQPLETVFSVINNACWSVGEIALQAGKGMAPFVQDLTQRLVAILGDPIIPNSVNENAGIALGRLGLANSDDMAQHLSMFAAQFLKSMETVEFTEEKVTAFTGFIMIVGRNPQALEAVLLQFFQAMARFDYSYLGMTAMNTNLQNLFVQAANAYRTLIPDFDGFLGQLSEADRRQMRETYSL